MLTLFELSTGEWADITRATGDVIASSYPFLLFFYLLSGMGITSLFAAIFVESLLAAKDERQRMHDALLKDTEAALRQDCTVLFQSADADGSGNLSRYEIETVLHLLDPAWSTPGSVDSFHKFPLFEKFQQGIAEKKAILGLKGPSVRSAVELAVSAMERDHAEEIPYTAVLEMVFEMDKAVSKRDNLIVNRELHSRLDSIEARQDEIIRSLQRLEGGGASPRAEGGA